MSSADKKIIPYGRQSIDESDIAAVVAALKSNWLTTGPLVGEFETALTQFTSAKFGVAISNGTAALHAAMNALRIGPGDEVILPSLTFAATANSVLYQGGTPVFADIESETLLINPHEIEKKISPKTKAVIAVDYAGNPCNYDAIRAITNKHKLSLVSDACHAIGGNYKGRSVGTLADMSTFSFHPVKHITTGEGGMILTDNEELARKMRIFRNHGITSDHREREAKGTAYYEMTELGFNYRLCDIQCALGISQVKKLKSWIETRNEIAQKYTQEFKKLSFLSLQRTQTESLHAHHLYVIRLHKEKAHCDRNEALKKLRDAGIAANVHYPPVHLHPYYQKHQKTKRGMLPITEAVYEELISLPMYPAMTDEDIATVIQAVRSLG